MKKIYKSILAILLVFVIAFTLPLMAFAEPENGSLSSITLAFPDGIGTFSDWSKFSGVNDPFVYAEFRDGFPEPSEGLYNGFVLFGPRETHYLPDNVVCRFSFEFVYNFVIEPHKKAVFNCGIGFYKYLLTINNPLSSTFVLHASDGSSYSFSSVWQEDGDSAFYPSVMVINTTDDPIVISSISTSFSAFGFSKSELQSRAAVITPFLWVQPPVISDAADSVSPFGENLVAVISDVGQANGWIWGLFGGFCKMLMENPLIAIPVLLLVLYGGIYLVVCLVRKFGLKGRNR